MFLFVGKKELLHLIHERFFILWIIYWFGLVRIAGKTWVVWGFTTVLIEGFGAWQWYEPAIYDYGWLISTYPNGTPSSSTSPQIVQQRRTNRLKGHYITKINPPKKQICNWNPKHIFQIRIPSMTNFQKSKSKTIVFVSTPSKYGKHVLPSTSFNTWKHLCFSCVKQIPIIASTEFGHGVLGRT